MATHSSVLAWRIPGTGEPGGLPPMGSHRVGHDWSDLAAAAAAHRGLEGLGDDLWIWWSTSGWMQSSHRRQLNASLLKTPLTAFLPYQEVYHCLLVLCSLTTHVLLETKHSVGSFSGGQQSIVHIKIINIPELMFPSLLIELFIMVLFIFPKWSWKKRNLQKETSPFHTVSKSVPVNSIHPGKLFCRILICNNH